MAYDKFDTRQRRQYRQNNKMRNEKRIKPIVKATRVRVDYRRIQTLNQAILLEPDFQEKLTEMLEDHDN